MGLAGFLHTLDLRLFTLVNGWAGRVPWFDKLSASFTKVSPVIFLVILTVCFFLPSPRRGEMRRTVILSGISGLLAVALSFLIMLFIYRPRPFAFLPPDQVQMLIQHVADSSFPSNHATGSAALAAGMAAAPYRSARWLTVLTALFVGLSRVVVGVHWPGDVIISFVLGIAAAKVVFSSMATIDPVIDPFLGLLSRLDPAEERGHPGERRGTSDGSASPSPDRVLPKGRGRRRIRRIRRRPSR